mmetsp:Transcript_22601/g.56702  ORF Transcript_22601/g.56702 Transcript_22601/m.56702 type:complete len:98 (-) Transcript_22601:2-295(-)|eukprot:CAMPEP_0177630648 /NCGR_PEP_ID=MMETSP0447-20121125/1325_1 /TAXON_ID=0 /ORGANISM="Stygamoeba regulata, Strain BSH-02190019" /LENGTH=97 /DNA_ID=CAMNT_0019132073 /DNA_START=68 /DNA_END=361 /DNA_ORIENTATION=+
MAGGSTGSSGMPKKANPFRRPGWALFPLGASIGFAFALCGVCLNNLARGQEPMFRAPEFLLNIVGRYRTKMMKDTMPDHLNQRLPEEKFKDAGTSRK